MPAPPRSDSPRFGVLASIGNLGDLIIGDLVIWYEPQRRDWPCAQVQARFRQGLYWRGAIAGSASSGPGFLSELLNPLSASCSDCGCQTLGRSFVVFLVLTAVQGFEASPDVAAQGFEIVAFLQKTETFANNLACGLVHATLHAVVHELLQFLGH